MLAMPFPAGDEVYVIKGALFAKTYKQSDTLTPKAKRPRSLSLTGRLSGAESSSNTESVDVLSVAEALFLGKKKA